MMGAGLCWLAVAYASLPGADEEQEPGPALVWSSRVQQYLLRDLPLLPDTAWRAESLLAGMVETDGSAISQLRHTWLISEPFNCWLEGQRTFGSASSTYGALPWRWQWQLGFRWQFV